MMMTTDEIEALVVLREQGMLQKEIAAALGCSEATARKWCQRAGVKTPPSQHPETVKWRRNYLLRRQRALDPTQGRGHP
jgi:transposase